MPGLSQLQKFNSDILSLGNEPTLRSQRGEQALSVPLPKGVKDIDDSDDFVVGMPIILNNVQEQKLLMMTIFLILLVKNLIHQVTQINKNLMLKKSLIFLIY